MPNENLQQISQKSFNFRFYFYEKIIVHLSFEIIFQFFFEDPQNFGKKFTFRFSVLSKNSQI